MNDVYPTLQPIRIRLLIRGLAPHLAVLVACAGVLAVTLPLRGQTANTAASIESAGEDDPSPGEQATSEQSAATDRLNVLRRELLALVRYDDAPREVEDVGSRLIDLSSDALDAREAAESVETRRAFAEIELRARHALVLLAAEAGQPIQTSIRSTQLRAAASRLAGSSAAPLSRLGRFYMTAAALGELQRDPSDAAARVEVAEDRLRRLSRADDNREGDRGEADGPGEAAAMDGGQSVDAEPSDADVTAPEGRAARVALAVLRGNVGQRVADNKLVERTERLDAPASVRPALARYRTRADMLDPPIRLREVIPPAVAEPARSRQARDEPRAEDRETPEPPGTLGSPADTGDAEPDADRNATRGSVRESASETTQPPADASASAATTAPPPLATGPVTIVHYFQNGRPASLAPLFALRNLRQTHDPERLNIVSVSLGPVLNWPEEADWPVLVSHGGSLGVEKLRVEVVPTFAVFDREGRLTIVSESAVVLEQVRAMLQQDADATP